MNDDKNRDWVEQAWNQHVLDSYHDKPDNKAHFIAGIEYVLAHIPPQPPIAEDVRELAHLLCAMYGEAVLDKQQYGSVIEKFCFTITTHDQKRDAERNGKVVKVLEQVQPFLEHLDGICPRPPKAVTWQIGNHIIDVVQESIPHHNKAITQLLKELKGEV